MLFLMFCYVGITCICLWAGILFYSFIYGEGHQRTVIHYILTGLMVVTAIGQWIVLVLPLNAKALFFITSLFIIFTIIRRERAWNLLLNITGNIKGGNKLFFVCFFCYFLMILVLNAGPFIMDDTDSYHIQMVKWIYEYGSVPGIANLHLRFGFNSSWFIAIAFFGFPIQSLNSYGALNGLLSVWICYYLLDVIFDPVRKEYAQGRRISVAGFVILILCLLNWPMIRGSASSMNYDFISTCCIIVLFTDLIKLEKKYPIEWLIWPMFLFTVRMMNFPLLILSLFYIIQFIKIQSFRKLLASVFWLFFVIVPFLIRNCILSGYAFFPVYQLDFFSFDWKSDKMQLMEISKYIRYFNRVNPMFQPIIVTENLTFPNWVLSWGKYLFRFDKLIVLFSVIGYIVLLFRLKMMRNKSYRVFLFVMVCLLATWFFIAPDPRFVYGSLLFSIFAAVIYLPPVDRIPFSIVKYSLICTSFFILIFAVSKLVGNAGYRNYLVTSPVPKPPYKTIVVDNIRLRIPQKILNNWNPRCYDIELPCLYKQDPRLEARGKAISDGFRLKNGGKFIFTDGEYKIGE